MQKFDTFVRIMNDNDSEQSLSDIDEFSNDEWEILEKKR